MDDVIVLENRFCDDGMCAVHLMSNLELSADLARKYGAPAGAKVEVKTEAGAFHLVASWPVQGLVSIHCEGWPVPKTMVVWNMGLCDSVKRALYEAAMEYEKLLLDRPQYAFIRKLPKGVENGTPIPLRVLPPNEEHHLGEEELLLFEAEWMVHKCVAVLGPK